MRTDTALTDLRVLVLAGGASSRFFPVNKVFADPTGSGRSMIQQAYDRVTARIAGEAWATFVEPSQFYVATGAGAVEKIMTQLALPAANVLIEPARRNTLPAILWALAHLRVDDGRAIVAILTADHVIGDVPVFRQTLAEAAAIARKRRAILTIGITPSDACDEWTPFGTIRAAAAVDDESASCIAAFEEKPSIERAAQMLSEGGWCWNAGMFVFRIDVFEAALAALQARSYGTYEAMAAAVADARMADAAQHFAALEAKIGHPLNERIAVDNSIDYAIMMPLSDAPGAGIEGRVIPARFAWWDIGSWDALRKVVAADARGNLTIGDVGLRDVSSCVLVAEPGRRVEADGLTGVVVVHGANDRVLVCSERLASKVKPLLERITANPAQRVVFSACGHCVVDAGGARVGLLGVEGLEVVCRNDTVTVRRLQQSAERGTVEEQCFSRLTASAQGIVPVMSQYAWGGGALPGFLGLSPDAANLPVAEAWLTSTQRDGEVGLQASPWTLAELVRQRPEVLGEWSRAVFGDEQPLFVKFLSPRFPPLVHMGFAPDALAAASRGDVPFSATLLGWLDREQTLLRELRAAFALERLRSANGFAAYRAAYEGWAIAQSLARWQDEGADDELLRGLSDLLVVDGECRDPSAIARDLRENRASIVGVLNEVDLEAEVGNLLLARAGLAHAIFGLSHQSHPRDPARAALAALYRELAANPGTGQDVASRYAPQLKALRESAHAAPKNEAWLAFRVADELAIMEPQQSSNTTYSWLDVYTPFVCREGEFVFRKGHPARGLDRSVLADYVASLDLAGDSVDTLRFSPVELRLDGGGDGARLFRLIDDPAMWPYFSVYRIDLNGSAGSPARCRADHPRGAFQQLVVVEGSALLSDDHGTQLVVSPGIPAFVPATANGGYMLRSSERATIYVVSIPVPGDGSPVRLP